MKRMNPKALQWLGREWWALVPLVPFLLMGLNFSYALLFGERCWSPNRQYYLIKVESLLSSALYAPGNKFGWVLVFDQKGNLLHHWNGDFFTYNRPTWKQNSVVFGTDDRLHLPTNGAADNQDKTCL
ncbi:hypothetical protein [Cupriavidus sp. BIS7]|uniref:hypothetical protein n=1 Tax=Cupriavidus sp. BIS7 TaxID=1217718 RepID=UPI0012F6E04C|nr:hypothetical protein [Cupriavidus sp. BIS7]